MESQYKREKRVEKLFVTNCKQIASIVWNINLNIFCAHFKTLFQILSSKNRVTNNINIIILFFSVLMSIMSEPHLEVERHWTVILVLFFKVQVWLPVENLFYTGLIPIMRSIHQGRCRGPHQLPVRLGKYNKKFREIDFPEKKY